MMMFRSRSLFLSNSRHSLCFPMHQSRKGIPASMNQIRPVVSYIGYNHTLPQEERTGKPMDPAYFTGNSNYYQFMTNLNEMLRKHNVSLTEPYKMVYGKDDLAKKKMEENKHLWKDRISMADRLEMRLNEQKYKEIISRLNLLLPFKDDDPVLNVLMQPFVRQSQSLISAKLNDRVLDEDGRAFAMASRKTAKSQAWLVPGQGQVYVNGVHLSDFFDGHLRLANHVLDPFEVTKTLGRYNVWAIVKGGGKRSQADALSVAISRAICIMDKTHEPILTSNGMTKIDLTQKERKKTGQPKARKKNTWVKR